MPGMIAGGGAGRANEKSLTEDSIHGDRLTNPRRSTDTTRSTRQETGKAASLHAGPAGDVIAINNIRSRIGQIVPRLIRFHPALVILFGMGLYLLCALFFAALFFGCGKECFDVTDGEDFTFLEVRVALTRKPSRRNRRPEPRQPAPARAAPARACAIAPIVHC